MESAVATPREEESPRIPWQCLLMVAAATCIWVGITWDISWHQSIGRDTFWTPAHILIQVGGLMAGFGGGWLIFKATFFPSDGERATTIRLFGLYGPVGAWVAVWAALAMVVSAPFDNWWHNAYGLDVKILSPPHALLAAGMHHVEVGALLLVASLQNRSVGQGRSTGQWLFIYTAGVMLALATLIIYEYSIPNLQHSAVFYQASSLLYPVLLVSIARASRLRFAATLAALIYLVWDLLLLWILPLFPATPMLAPIYNPVDYMVPRAFPLLLFVPALGIDLIFWWLGKKPGLGRNVLLAILLAPCFLGLFWVTQWWFSAFLISPMAENWFFGGNQFWSYNHRVGDWRHEFWTRRSPMTSGGMAWALVWATVSTVVGLIWGGFMSRIQR